MTNSQHFRLGWPISKNESEIATDFGFSAITSRGEAKNGFEQGEGESENHCMATSQSLVFDRIWSVFIHILIQRKVVEFMI